MNVSEIIVGNKKLTEYNNSIAIFSPYISRSDKVLYINELFINGKKVQLNNSCDGIELSKDTTEIKTSGSISVNKLVTDTFILENNMVLVPLVLNEQMNVIYENEQYILINNLNQKFITETDIDSSMRQHNLSVHVVGKVNLSTFNKYTLIDILYTVSSSCVLLRSLPS